MRNWMQGPAPRHQFWIDRGGTFTDCIHRDPDTGALRVTKVLSSDRAPLQGIRALLDLGPKDPIPPCEVRMGTTLATNALLERNGRRCALVANEGLGDLHRIGDQTRPDLFALHIEKPLPLADSVIEVGARISADGSVLHSLDREALRVLLRDLLAEINQLATQLAPLPRQWEMAHALTKLAQRSRAMLTVPWALSACPEQLLS